MREFTEESLVGLVKVLEEVRIKRICCYGGRNFCDCKYGGKKIGDLRHLDITSPNYIPPDESCGCPEMREAEGILRRLTLDEVQKILKRSPVR